MIDVIADKLIPMCDLYEEYLRDESRLSGNADFIAFPQSEEEVAELVVYAADRHIPITVQGSRTGIAGAAVPSGGLVISLSRMDKILSVDASLTESCTAAVQSGVQCAQLSDELRRLRLPFFFAADPTETTASFGGMFACNAGGIAAMRYGKTGDYVTALRMVQRDGSILELCRGQAVFDGGVCVLPDGRRLELPYTDYPRVTELLSPKAGSDLIDLLAGSEGTLGIVTSMTVRLMPIPAQRWGVLFFFQAIDDSYSFMEQTETVEQLPAKVVCIEFYDAEALAVVTHQKAVMSRLKAIPDMPPGCCCGVYIELEADSEEDAEELLVSLLGFFEETGGQESDSWAACGAQEMEKFRLLRHAVPEGINVMVDAIRQTNPNMRKLALDFSCRSLTTAQLIEKYSQSLLKFSVPGVIFGHAATRHLHVNLLPTTDDEQAAARQLVTQLAGEIAALGGCLAEENGIGKLKTELLEAYITPEQRQVMDTVRNFFDAEEIFNPHNILRRKGR